MNDAVKKNILEETKSHISMVRRYVKHEEKKTRQSLRQSKELFKTLPAADQIVETQLIKFREKRLNEFGHLHRSPYFIRCDVVFENEKELRSIYFSKFGLREKQVYSWIAPVASIRFEPVGQVSYRKPNGTRRKVQVLRKDQYMIVDGKIKFLATESQSNSRELVYQEYFSNRKTGFVLPEIVAQMEKAQDQVIRAHHQGPLLISGPAGSGKTTLALHRIAYLVQAPDVAEHYPSHSIIVFVQDAGTKEYFSHLLPELGIQDINITTFDEWAFSILGISGKYQPSFGSTELERDCYEYRKIQALRQRPLTAFQGNICYSLLERTYAPYFSEDQKKIFMQQKKKKILDRIDLTLLLQAYRNNMGSLAVKKHYLIESKNGKIHRKYGSAPLEYSLGIVDEFQNYLPEQLSLIKSCINPKNRSILYVGDLAQQVRLGTLRDWKEIGEAIEPARRVVLQKVYRNTKNILQYIKSLRYEITIPEGLPDGPKVEEYISQDGDEQIKYIRKILSASQFSTAAILAKDEPTLDRFRQAFAEDKRIHVLTMNEAQGVEFDIVFIVGISRDSFSLNISGMISELIKEKRRINRDLLYVALTRAMTRLHIIGSASLKEIFTID